MNINCGIVQNLSGVLIREKPCRMISVVSCGKISGGFAGVTGITVRTQKIVNNTRTEPAGDRVFHANHIADLMPKRLI